MQTNAVGPIRGPQAKLVRSNSAVVSSPLGNILIGCPPEISKAFFAQGLSFAPTIVVTDNFLSGNKVTSEPEYPSLASIFIAQKKPTLIGSRGAIERLEILLQESILSSKDLPEADRKIRDHFAKKEEATGRVLRLDELVNFKIFSSDRMDMHYSSGAIP